MLIYLKSPKITKIRDFFRVSNVLNYRRKAWFHWFHILYNHIDIVCVYVSNDVVLELVHYYIILFAIDTTYTINYV